MNTITIKLKDAQLKHLAERLLEIEHKGEVANISIAEASGLEAAPVLTLTKDRQCGRLYIP